MSLPLYQEFAYHVLAGVSLALGDRYFSGNAKRHTEKRVEQKLRSLESLNYLASLSQTDISVLRQDPIFRDHMRNARDYFSSRGVRVEAPSAQTSQSRLSQFTDRLAKYRSVERINPLSFSKKLGAAFGLEFIMDSFAVVNQALGGSSNALAAFAKTTYQAPALFVGLVTGKAILSAADYFRSKEEKEADSLGRELTSDGSLLTRVKAYYTTPTPVAQPSAVTDQTSDATSSPAAKEGTLLDDVTQKVTTAGASVLLSIKQHMTRRREQKEAKEQELRDKVKRKLDRY